MNYTQNYQLPQWEKTDRIMMDDFNDAMSKVENGFGEMPKIASGSYIGSGTFGSGSPKTVTPGFVAKLVVIMRDDYSISFSGIFLRPCRNGLARFDSNASVTLTWSDTSVSWYSDSGAENMLNASGITYRWWAIG